MARSKPPELKNTIAEILDDLTHLEVNTIIKSGMVASPPLSSIEEIAFQLLKKYIWKLELMLDYHEDIQYPNFEPKETKTFQKLSTTLTDLDTFMHDRGLRLAQEDYVILLRMRACCAFAESHQAISKISGGGSELEGTNLFTANLEKLVLSDGKFTMDTRTEVSIKRMYDLGTETIVMQTRFGIDGDVVTRIEESFAKAPRQLVLETHDKHLNLSVRYWQSLIKIVENLVTSLFNNKSKSKG